MGQWFKKVTLSLTAASVIATSFAVPFASAVNAAEANPVVINYDFESFTIHGNDSPSVDTDDSEHGKAAKYQLNSVEGNQSRFNEIGYGDSFAPKGKYIVSYDVKLTSNQQGYRFMLRDSAGVDFAFIDFTNDNRIITGKTGSGTEVGNKNTDYSTSEVLNDCGTYVVNQWYNISIAVDPKDNGGSEIEYYLDGKLISTANASGKANSNGKAAKMYLGAYKTLDENGNVQYPTNTYMWIDNYMVQYADSAYYTALTNSAPKVSGNTITVDFIEPICTDGYNMTNIKLYDSNNAEVSVATATVSGKTLKITGATLVNGEYHIALPSAFKGVSGVKPAVDVISFVNGAETRVNGEVAWVTDQNFTQNTKGFIGQNNTIISKKLEDENYVVTFSQDSSKVNQWQAAISDLKTVVPTADCSFLDKDYNMSDIFVMSTDYYFPKGTGTDKISGTGDITTKLEGKNKQFMKYKFTKDGRFICLSMNESGVWVEEISVNVEAERWYTIKSVISKKDKYVDYYLCIDGTNERYIGTTYFNTDEICAESTCIRTIYGHLSGNSTDGWIGGNYYIDNIKAGYILNTEYKKIVDSQPESADSHAISAGKTIRTGKTYMVDFDVTPANLSEAGVEFRIKGTAGNRNIIFKMYKNGTLKMSNGSIDNWSDDYTYTLPVSGISDGKAFNIKVYFDNDIVVNNEGSQRRRRAYLYIDNVFARAFALGNGNETGDYATDLDLSTLFFTTVTGSANAKISNFKLGYTSKIPYIESAVVYNQNDSMGHAFASQNIKSDIQKIVLNVADASYATNGTLTAGTAKLTNGTSEIELEAVVDNSQIVLKTKDGAYVPNGKWTLNYTGSSDCGDYTASFTVNETRTLVDNSQLSVIGTKAELAGTIQNFEAKKTVSVIIAEYSVDNPRRLVNVFTKEVELQSGTNTLTGLELTGSTDNKNNYKAFIWETISGMAPVFSAKTAE